MSASMFLETVRSEGLGHLSYFFGHQGSAAVVDPRRDCRVYLDMARERSVRIDYVFETHRHEDYLSGARELGRLAGADVLHGAALDFHHGQPAEEGDLFMVGGLEVKVLETPGHTPESISLALADTTVSRSRPVAVFTGDALFVNEVGRTDFYDPVQEWAAKLYDSIHNNILPLGDGVILCPAHGAGSVCGLSMADREFSTLGLEREHNPMLQLSRDEFVRRKSAEVHASPPYFRTMERLNKEGSARAVHEMPDMPMLSAEEAALAMKRGALGLDIRSPEAFAGAFIPGTLATPLDMIPAYAGHFLDADRDVVLIPETNQQAEHARTLLLRQGFDRLAGFLAGGMHSWEVQGRAYDRIPAVHVDELTRRIVEEEDFTLLDVRSKAEYDAGQLSGAMHIPLTELDSRQDEIPHDRPVTTFCGSGKRAIIAASILKQAGFESVEDSLGSMSACQSQGCPLGE